MPVNQGYNEHNGKIPGDWYFKPYNAEICLYIFFQFEIIINVSVSSFRFIWIHISWVSGHYKYFYSYSTGIEFRRRITTYKVDAGAVRVYILCNRSTMIQDDDESLL